MSWQLLALKDYQYRLLATDGKKTKAITIFYSHTCGTTSIYD